MTTSLKDKEEYIRHEVEIRIHDEKFRSQDLRFLRVEEAIKHVNGKINWLLGIGLSSVLLPVLLHWFKLV